MKTLIGLVYKYAMERGVIEKNLADYMFVGNDKKGTWPPFTAAEIEKVRLAVGIVPYADYVYCLIYTGYRPEELLSREKADYSAEHNCIFGGIKTEAGKEKIMPVSPKISPIVQAQLKLPNKYLFPRKDTGTRMKPEYFREYCFNPCMEALGIKGKVPYSCRHTFANLMKAAEGADVDKAALMGHSDFSMTKYYQSADFESLRRIVDALL